MLQRSYGWRSQLLRLRPRGLLVWGFSWALVLGVLSVISADETPTYLLGPGDVLCIEIVDAGLRYSVPVLADGSISIPYAGRVVCQGKTLDDVASDISGKLAQELKAHRVAARVVTPRERLVYVLGTGVSRTVTSVRAGAQGSVALQSTGQVLLRPGMKISHLLAAAGGLTGGPQSMVAWLRRPTGESLAIDLAAVLLKGDPQADLALREGDVLVVERVDAGGVYVTGAVVLPGAYQIAPGAGAAQAILAAGGPAPGADLQRVDVWRSDRTRISLDLSAALLNRDFSKDVPIRPGDVVAIPGAPQSAPTVVVTGAVSRPGYYGLKGGRIRTVDDVLRLAGGARSTAASVLVIREIEGNPVTIALDIERAGEQPIRARDVVVVVSEPLGSVSE